MRVSIIIPAWNLWETTRACLRSLAEHPDGLAEVVVADNGSTDATREQLPSEGKRLFGERFTLVRLERNLGFAAGCNAGARAASGDALLFLNNDTTVTPGWLSPLTLSLQRDGVGAVGPLLLYPDGTNQHCGVSFSLLRNPRHLYERFPGDHPALRTTHPLQAITGAALLLRRRHFDEACGFHEGYVNGYEDLDLCCALRDRGLRLAVEPSSTIFHHESKTPGRHRGDTDNADLFTSRWGGRVHADLHLQAAVDGYAARLSPRLVSYLALPPPRERDLNDHFAAPPDTEPQKLRAALAAEPLWQGGYLLLATLLERQGDMENALNTALRAVTLFPVNAAQRALLRIAGRMGLRDVADAALEMLRPIAPDTRRENARTVRFHLRAAQERGDAALAEIFLEWLRKESER